MPIKVERTEQKPHADYKHKPHKAPITVSSLTLIEILQISGCQERASDKRLKKYVSVSPARLTLSRAPASGL